MNIRSITPVQFGKIYKITEATSKDIQKINDISTEQYLNGTSEKTIAIQEDSITKAFFTGMVNRVSEITGYDKQWAMAHANYAGGDIDDSDLITEDGEKTAWVFTGNDIEKLFKFLTKNQKNNNKIMRKSVWQMKNNMTAEAFALITAKQTITNSKTELHNFFKNKYEQFETADEFISTIEPEITD